MNSFFRPCITHWVSDRFDDLSFLHSRAHNFLDLKSDRLLFFRRQNGVCRVLSRHNVVVPTYLDVLERKKRIVPECTLILLKIDIFVLIFVNTIRDFLMQIARLLEDCC